MTGRSGDRRRHPAAAAGQVVRRRARRHGHRPGHPGRPVLFTAGRVRLRQDHDAAHDRRIRETRLRAHRTRRPRRGRRSAAPASGQHRLPDLCAVPVHDGLGQRRVRAEVPEGVTRGDQAPRRRGAGTGPDGRLRQTPARASCPAASNSASRWRGPWCCGHACCCSTSRSAPWTRKLRKQLQLELRAVQREVGITFVYVTHDQEEALTMSDQIAVLAEGRVEQVGPPQEIYSAPATTFVAGFLGAANIFDADVLEASRRVGGVLGAGHPARRRGRRLRRHRVRRRSSSGRSASRCRLGDDPVGPGRNVIRGHCRRGGLPRRAARRYMSTSARRPR